MEANCTKSAFAIILLALIVCSIHVYGKARKTPRSKDLIYTCTPCGHDCDNKTYKEAGKCMHCNMPLVKKSTIHFKTIDPDKICEYIASHPSVILLDVRTKDEFEGRGNPDFGTLQNAINIPVQELEGRLNEIGSLKNKEIIVYCSHSHRSPMASYILTQNGFNNITNMTGGMSLLLKNNCKK